MGQGVQAGHLPLQWGWSGFEDVWTSGASYVRRRGTWDQSVYYTLVVGVGDPLLFCSDDLHSEETLAVGFLFHVRDAATAVSAEFGHRLAGTHGSRVG